MMDYVFIAISALLIICCAYFVISPFFARQTVATSAAGANDENTIESIYNAVNELEMDLLMKKISEEDFLELKEKYEDMAASLLGKERDSLGEKHSKENLATNVDKELLKELEILRKSRERGK